MVPVVFLPGSLPSPLAQNDHIFKLKLSFCCRYEMNIAYAILKGLEEVIKRYLNSLFVA